ncbi:MAG: DUF177 domain-containing protein [Clostridiales bacterium]|nr:DUF177 domain-containing protein [Clostridiales bacterium]
MIIQLKQLFDIDGDKKEISYDLPADQIATESLYSFSKPIAIRGEVLNRAGVLTLSMKCDFSINLICDRCLKEFEREYKYSFKHILVKSCNPDNDEYIVCADNTLDLNELVISDILLTMPSKILCEEECKGLCYVCGADLNEGTCEHVEG